MKTHHAFIVLIYCLLSFSAQATIYKMVDRDGNVVFTDVKPKDSRSQEVELKPITPIQSTPLHTYPAPVNQGDNDDPPDYYSEFKIVEPANEATVRNSGSFAVKLVIVPKLSLNHKIRLLLDGNVFETRRSLYFTLLNIDRGAHTVTAEVINGKGKVIQSTDSTVYVQRVIVKP